MTSVVTVYKDAGTTAAIAVTSLEYSCVKTLLRFPDDDGVNNWGDKNRYMEQYSVSGTVSIADLEDLKAAQQIVMGSTYPKIDVYDKSAADYYNTYSPVQFVSFQASRITHALWRVKCTFQW